MLVTVVVTSYNRLSLLERCLASVEAQTYREWECLVCDDGSTDGSYEYVRALEARDPRFRLVLGPRFGFPAGPRNRGIAEARGEWVAFLDDDDLWHPSKLERQLAIACDANVQALATKLLMFKEDQPPTWMPHDSGAESQEIALDRILTHRQPYPSTPAVMIRRACLLEVGGFAEHAAYRAVEDYDLWARVRMQPALSWRWVGGTPLTAAREHGSDAISAWKRWFHPDNVRQRWAMLEILTRIVAAQPEALEAARPVLLAAITDLADDCAHRSAMLGWRRDALFAYRLAARFSGAGGDPVGSAKRYLRAARFGLVSRPSHPAPRLEHIGPLRERIARSSRAILEERPLRSDPLAIAPGGAWSSLASDRSLSAGTPLTRTA